MELLYASKFHPFPLKARGADQACTRREEDTKIAIRNVRRDVADKFKQMEKDKDISQDECRMALNKLQQLTDGVTTMVEKNGRPRKPSQGV